MDTKRKKSPKVRARTLESALERTVKEIAREEGTSPIATYKSIEGSKAVEVLGSRSVRQMLTIDKLLERLQDIIDDMPDKAPKHSDIIKAIELVAKIKGMIDRPKEEKHLHLHGVNLKEVSESDLRKELARIESEKKQGT